MKIKSKIIAPIFLAVELGLYIVILFFYDALPFPDFTAVALAVAFSFCFFQWKTPNLFLHAGILSTVIADVFLVLIGSSDYRCQIFGMIFFSITQLSYFAYLYQAESRPQMKKAQILVRVLAVAVALAVTVIVLQENTDALSLLSLFYVTNLAVNVLFAYLQGKKRLLFAIGLTLFLCCDLFVGFQVAIGSYIHVAETSLLYKIVFANFNFVWFFYLPSQTCISTYIAIQNERQR